jgi:hypothetical protein
MERSLFFRSEEQTKAKNARSRRRGKLVRQVCRNVEQISSNPSFGLKRPTFSKAGSCARKPNTPPRSNPRNGLVEEHDLAARRARTFAPPEGSTTVQSLEPQTPPPRTQRSAEVRCGTSTPSRMVPGISRNRKMRSKV